MANPRRRLLDEESKKEVDDLEDDDEVSLSHTTNELSQSQQKCATRAESPKGFDRVGTGRSYLNFSSNRSEKTPVSRQDPKKCPSCEHAIHSRISFENHITSPDSICKKDYMVNGHFLYDVQDHKCFKCDEKLPHCPPPMNLFQQLIIHVKNCHGPIPNRNRHRTRHRSRASHSESEVGEISSHKKTMNNTVVSNSHTAQPQGPSHATKGDSFNFNCSICSDSYISEAVLEEHLRKSNRCAENLKKIFEDSSGKRVCKKCKADLTHLNKARLVVHAWNCKGLQKQRITENQGLSEHRPPPHSSATTSIPSSTVVLNNLQNEDLPSMSPFNTVPLRQPSTWNSRSGSGRISPSQPVSVAPNGIPPQQTTPPIGISLPAPGTQPPPRLQWSSEPQMTGQRFVPPPQTSHRPQINQMPFLPNSAMPPPPTPPILPRGRIHSTGNNSDVESVMSSSSRMTSSTTSMQALSVYDPRDEQLRRDYVRGQVTPIAKLIGLIKKCGICNFESATFEDGVKHIYDHNKIRCPRCFQCINLLETHYIDHMKTHFVKSRSKPEHVMCSYCTGRPFGCNYHKLWDHVINEHLKKWNQKAAADDDDAPEIIKEVIANPARTWDWDSSLPVQPTLPGRPPEITVPPPSISAQLPTQPSSSTTIAESTTEVLLNEILNEAGSSSVGGENFVKAGPPPKVGGKKVKRPPQRRDRFTDEHLEHLIPTFLENCNNIKDPQTNVKIWITLANNLSAIISRKAISIRKWFNSTRRAFMSDNHPNWAKTRGVNDYIVILRPDGLITIVSKTPQSSHNISTECDLPRESPEEIPNIASNDENIQEMSAIASSSSNLSEDCNQRAVDSNVGVDTNTGSVTITKERTPGKYKRQGDEGNMNETAQRKLRRDNASAHSSQGTIEDGYMSDESTATVLAPVATKKISPDTEIRPRPPIVDIKVDLRSQEDVKPVLPETSRTSSEKDIAKTKKSVENLVGTSKNHRRKEKSPENVDEGGTSLGNYSRNENFSGNTEKDNNSRNDKISKHNEGAKRRHEESKILQNCKSKNHCAYEDRASDATSANVQKYVESSENNNHQLYQCENPKKDRQKKQSTNEVQTSSHSKNKKHKERYKGQSDESEPIRIKLIRVLQNTAGSSTVADVAIPSANTAEGENGTQPALLTSPKTNYLWKTTFNVSMPKMPKRDAPTAPEIPGQINQPIPSDCSPPKIPRQESPPLQRRRVSGLPNGDGVTLANVALATSKPADKPQPSAKSSTITNSNSVIDLNGPPSTTSVSTEKKPPATTNRQRTPTKTTRTTAAPANNRTPITMNPCRTITNSPSSLGTTGRRDATPTPATATTTTMGLSSTISHGCNLVERTASSRVPEIPSSIPKKGMGGLEGRRPIDPRHKPHNVSPPKMPRQEFMIKTPLLSPETYKDRFRVVQKLSRQELSKIALRCRPIFQQMNEMFFGNNAEQKFEIIKQSKLLVPFANKQKAFTCEQKLYIDELMEERAKQLPNPRIQHGNTNFKYDILRHWFPVILYALATDAKMFDDAIKDFVVSSSRHVEGNQPNLKAINKIFLDTKLAERKSRIMHPLHG